MTYRVKKVRQGERRAPGTLPQPRPTVTSDAEASAKPGSVVRGWGRQLSGGLVGEDSQREALPLGPLCVSVYKYQGYALIFLLNFRPLEGKERK